MRVVNLNGLCLNLRHNHFTSTQNDLLSFCESLLKSAIGTTEQGTPTPAKILTSKLSYANGTLSWTDGWCVINGKIRRVYAGSTEIIQTGNRTYYFEASDNELLNYRYVNINGETQANACAEQSVVVTSDDTGFKGFDVENKITIGGYKTNVYSSEAITNYANIYYNFSRVNDKNNQLVSQALDGISSERRKNSDSVQMFYIEVNNWDMSTSSTKTVNYPPHINLDESNVSVMSYSFVWVNDINTLSRNDDFTISFGKTSCIITRPGLEGALYGGTGFRGVLKIEAYTYCHIPS